MAKMRWAAKARCKAARVNGSNLAEVKTFNEAFIAVAKSADETFGGPFLEDKAGLYQCTNAANAAYDYFTARQNQNAMVANYKQNYDNAMAACKEQIKHPPEAEATVYARKEKGDDWDKMRAAYTLAGGGIEDLSRAMLAGFMVQYNSTMTMLQDSSTEDLPPSDRAKLLASLADAFTKTVSANARVMPETSKLATALELIEFLMAFVQEKHPKHLPAFVEVLEPFGAEVEKKFG